MSGKVVSITEAIPQMNCPSCRSSMAPKELNGAPVFVCDECGDFFMKRDVFSAVVGVTADAHVHHKSGKVHDCPGCHGEMSGTDVLGVELDYCPHCEIVVSDRASFSHIIEDKELSMAQEQGLGQFLLHMDVERNVDNAQRLNVELEDANKLKVDDLFILYKSGILLSSYTTTVDETLDKDVLGSMLMAITDFVQTSFKRTSKTGKAAKLSSIKLEDKEIAFEHGEFIVVALALSGSLPPTTRKKVSATLKKVESENKDILCDWDGDLGKVKDVALCFKDLLSK